VPLVLASLVTPASAGLFSRKPKTNPAERVPELLLQLKTSPDEAARTAAEEELRQYDPKSYPEIMTGLIDALGRDTSPGVRSEAATSLGKLRPISQQAGYALEQAQNNDASMRVRLMARQALWQYHLIGYRSGKPTESPANGGGDATAMAPPGPGTPATPTASRQAPRSMPAHNYARETPEPPLALPAGATAANDTDGGKTVATPASRSRGAVPAQLIPSPLKLQQVPGSPTPAPSAKPAPQAPAPPAKPDGDGPSLPSPGA